MDERPLRAGVAPLWKLNLRPLVQFQSATVILLRFPGLARAVMEITEFVICPRQLHQAVQPLGKFAARCWVAVEALPQQLLGFWMLVEPGTDDRPQAALHLPKKHAIGGFTWKLGDQAAQQVDGLVRCTLGPGHVP